MPLEPHGRGVSGPQLRRQRRCKRQTAVGRVRAHVRSGASERDPRAVPGHEPTRPTDPAEPLPLPLPRGPRPKPRCLLSRTQRERPPAHTTWLARLATSPFYSSRLPHFETWRPPLSSLHASSLPFPARAPTRSARREEVGFHPRSACSCRGGGGVGGEGA